MCLEETFKQTTVLTQGDTWVYIHGKGVHREKKKNITAAADAKVVNHV